MQSAVVVLKTRPDIESIKTSHLQADQIRACCYANEIIPIDYVISFSGIKDILKKIKQVDGRKRFEIVAIYSPMQITKDPNEYKEFVSCVTEDFQAKVMYVRARM